MKKLLLLSLSVGLAQVSYGQTTINTGTIQVGGSISYQYQTSQSPYNYSDGFTYYTTTQHTTEQFFSTYPTVGYFVADNLVVGLGVGSSSSKRNYSYDKASGSLVDSELLATQLSIGPFVQYYRMLTPWFGLTGTLNTSYFTYFQRSRPFISQDRAKGVAASIFPGIVFFPVQKLALGASFGSLSYNYSSGEPNSFPGRKSSSWSLNSSFGLSYLAISGTYYFRRSKT